MFNVQLSFQPRKQVVQPEVADFFLDRVLFQPRIQIREIDMVQRLVLIEAGKDDRFLPCRRIDVLLQALCADFFHHALHWRVDARDGDVVGLKQGLKHAMPCLFDRSHHSVGTDRNDPPNLRQWN